MKKKNLRAKKILGKYNYWRKSLKMSFFPKKNKEVGTNCQVACHSDPCNADPTCDFN